MKNTQFNIWKTVNVLFKSEEDYFTHVEKFIQKHNLADSITPIMGMLKHTLHTPMSDSMNRLRFDTQQVDLVKVTPAQMGFLGNQSVSYIDIYDKGISLGLKRCPLEIPLLLLTQYETFLKSKFTFATIPIFYIGEDSPEVFTFNNFCK